MSRPCSPPRRDGHRARVLDPPIEMRPRTWKPSGLWPIVATAPIFHHCPEWNCCSKRLNQARPAGPWWTFSLCGEVDHQNSRAQPRGPPPPARASTLLIVCYLVLRLVSAPTRRVADVSAPLPTCHAHGGGGQTSTDGGRGCLHRSPKGTRSTAPPACEHGSGAQEDAREGDQGNRPPSRAHGRPRLSKRRSKTNAMKRSRQLPVDGSGAVLDAQSSL
jgi:hypothetical protein